MVSGDSSLTAVRANLGERRRTEERAKKVDLYSRRTPANDYEHSFGGLKNRCPQGRGGSNPPLGTPLSAPGFRIRIDRISLSEGRAPRVDEANLTAVLTAVRCSVVDSSAMN